MNAVCRILKLLSSQRSHPSRETAQQRTAEQSKIKYNVVVFSTNDSHYASPCTCFLGCLALHAVDASNTITINETIPLTLSPRTVLHQRRCLSTYDTCEYFHRSLAKPNDCRCDITLMKDLSPIIIRVSQIMSLLCLHISLHTPLLNFLLCCLPIMAQF
jgi:hypothetical protein